MLPIYSWPSTRIWSTYQRPHQKNNSLSSRSYQLSVAPLLGVRAPEPVSFHAGMLTDLILWVSVVYRCSLTSGSYTHSVPSSLIVRKVCFDSQLENTVHCGRKGHGSKNLRQFSTLCSQSEAVIKKCTELTVSFKCSLGAQYIEMAPSSLGESFPPSYPNLDNSSQTSPQVWSSVF